MALKLWLGNSGSGKSHALFSEVISEAAIHTDRTYLVIVPEQFTLQTQRDLVELDPRGGIMNVDVLSFARLSYRVFEEVGFGKAPGLLIDDMGKNLILRHLAGELGDELKVIGNNLKKLGYISEVKSIISEFMQYGVDDEKLQVLLEAGRNNNRRLLCDKLEDIELLYHAFRDYIESKYTTSEELLTRVSSALLESEKLGNSVIILDGFTGFTPVQYNLIKALLHKCVDVHVSVLLDTISGNEQPYDEQELFYLSRKTIRELKHIAEEEHIPILPDHIITDSVPYRFRIPSEQPKMLIHLERNLFREDSAPYADKITDDISIASARNPLDEMTMCAVMIQRLVREKNYRYKDIAIVSGDLDTYSNAILRVFSKYQIPYFLDKTQPLLMNPFAEYLRAVLQILREDYRYDGVFAYLKSGMTDFTKEEVDLLENYVLACGINGRKQWNSRFIRCPKSFTQEQLLYVDSLRERFMEPFSLFDDMHTVRDYCVALYRMMTSLKIQEKLENKRVAYVHDKDALKAKEYQKIYREIVDLLNKLVELLGDVTMDISEYSDLIDAGISEIRIGIVPATTDYVQVGDITRSRLRTIKALFFVGVNEGIVPPMSSGGGLLSDIDREFFVDKGVAVELAPTARMRAYTQRLYLYMLMTKPMEKLYISYARVGDDAGAIKPSYLIKQLHNMFASLTEHRFEDLSLSELAYNEITGRQLLSGGMQDYISNQINVVQGFRAEESKNAIRDYENLMQVYMHSPENAAWLRKITEVAFLRDISATTNSVNATIAHVIYGNNIVGSVTRLETYAKCAFAHFMRYGLDVREREEFTFEAREMGSVFHDALKNYTDLLAQKNLSWTSVSEEESRELVREAVKSCIVHYDAVYATFRSTYTVERINRIMNRTVSVLTEHIRKGDFVPSRFELDFAKESDLSAINFRLSLQDRMRLVGRIDRVDLLDKQDSIYVKIIDYKSSDKKVDLAAIYSGEQLQLVVYLNAAMEMQQKQHPEKSVYPAGILYYHMEDPIVEEESSDTDALIREKIHKELSMKGLVSSDESVYRSIDTEFVDKSDIIPITVNKSGELSKYSTVASNDEFKLISDYVNVKIREMGQSILDGNIEVEPGNCLFCEYKSVCRSASDEKKQDSELKGLGRDEILDKMREKVQSIQSNQREN